METELFQHSLEIPTRENSSSTRLNEVEAKGDVIEVSIAKSDTLGYGFSIMGGDPIGSGKELSSVHISKLKPGSPAETTGLLTVGQLVLAINDVSIVGASHKEVVEHLKRATGVVKLKLQNVSSRKTDVVLAQLGYEKVRILFPFVATSPDEMSLTRDEVVFVEGKGTDGWCFGRTESGKSGMFPGQFALKLKPTREILSSLASELETMSPGISHRVNSEVLYEEIHPVSGSGESKATDFKSENMFKKNSFSNMSDTKATPEDKNDENQAMAVYPMAQTSTFKPNVTLVGKQILLARFDENDIDYTHSKEHSYAPINDYGSGVVIYEPTVPENTRRLQPTSSITSQDSKPPPIEDLYASVNKVKAAKDETHAGYSFEIVDDIYATIETTIAPKIPQRAYKKELLPPTMRVHLQEQTDDTYERLPGQKEFDVDVVHKQEEVEVVPPHEETKVAPPRLSNSAPGVAPALPPMRKGPSIHNIKRDDASPAASPSKTNKQSTRRDKQEVAEKKKESAEKRKSNHKSEKESKKQLKDAEKLAKKEAKEKKKEEKKEKKEHIKEEKEKKKVDKEVKS